MNRFLCCVVRVLFMSLASHGVDMSLTTGFMGTNLGKIFLESRRLALPSTLLLIQANMHYHFNLSSQSPGKYLYSQGQVQTSFDQKIRYKHGWSA
jgi:hypothetical protein